MNSVNFPLCSLQAQGYGLEQVVSCYKSGVMEQLERAHRSPTSPHTVCVLKL